MTEAINQPVFIITDAQRQYVLGHLKYYLKPGAFASEVGIRVAHLLELWQGLHHIDSAAMKRADWSSDLYVALKVQQSLATWDFNELTTLVFLAHDHCIRVDVHPSMKFLEIMFHPRKSRDGGMSQRHPTLERAVARWRERFPVTRDERGNVPLGKQ